MANLQFAQRPDKKDQVEKHVYKLLIVDDDESVHVITKAVIGSMRFKTYGFDIMSAYSAAEAKEMLRKHDDIALAFVDVIMETSDAGLLLVDHIRDVLKYDLIRLIIRTGQPGEAPEMSVIDRYDIDDYKEKTELTVEKLYTTIRTSIKQYVQLCDLKKKYEDTYKQLTTNPLTELPNRIKLNEDLLTKDREILVLIDIIAFSAINETNGFEVGDTILQELGAFLFSMYSGNYDVYHLEADVFAILLPSILPKKAEELVMDIKDDIAALHIITDNFDKTIDTTIGVAYDGEKNIIQKAELALNEAKRSGKNHIQFYRDDLKIIKHIEQTQYWGALIKEALLKEDIIAYYQPIVDIETHTVDKYEMLARLRHDGNIYTPFYFLEAAKDSGQLFEIFKYMFEQACKIVSDTPVHLSINIGDTELNHPELFSFVGSTLESYGVERTWLSLEILEYNSVSEFDHIKDNINRLHELGLEIIIDDFGTKCSNFSQLENLTVKVLKIDGTYIKDIDSCKDSQIVVRTIKRYADEKGVKVVAEFVHSKEVYEYIKAIGIDYAQGYYLGRPAERIDDLGKKGATLS